MKKYYELRDILMPIRYDDPGEQLRGLLYELVNRGVFTLEEGNDIIHYYNQKWCE